MTYAGRLDPMASGLLLILAGEEIKNKEKYLTLSKEYEFEVLFSIATDTRDILGKIISFRIDTKIDRKSLEKKIKNNLKFFIGKFMQNYPVYSSKTIKHARAGKKVRESDHIVEVKKLKLIKFRTISASNLLKNIEGRVGKVEGDFRQNEILRTWRAKLTDSKEVFTLASFRVECGSGMYVRALAHDLGNRIKLPTLAFRIKRVKIGKWHRASNQNIKS